MNPREFMLLELSHTNDERKNLMSRLLSIKHCEHCLGIFCIGIFTRRLKLSISLVLEDKLQTCFRAYK
jgi:hypothetical protein